jgi:hypothetical protein
MQTERVNFMERKTQTIETEGKRVFVVTRTYLTGTDVPEYLFRTDRFELKPEIEEEIAEKYYKMKFTLLWGEGYEG